jgi:hypothetical protein
MAGIPQEFLELMNRPWRAQPETTVGGWCVTLAEDLRTPAEGALAIAMFLSRDIATHIAEMHNRSLEQAPPVPQQRAAQAAADEPLESPGR